jgi:hypothetical protein
MTAWLVLAASLVLVVVAVLGFWKAIRAKVATRQRIAVWTIAVVTGAASLLLPAYPIDSRTRAIGFPLPAAFFQKDEHGHWLDYVGPLTIPFFYGNAVVNAGVILFIGVFVATRRQRNRLDQDPAGPPDVAGGRTRG